MKFKLKPDPNVGKKPDSTRIPSPGEYYNNLRIDCPWVEEPTVLFLCPGGPEPATIELNIDFSPSLISLSPPFFLIDSTFLKPRI